MGGEAVALRRSRCDLAHSRLLVAESLADVSGQLLFGPTKTYAARNVVIPRFLVDELHVTCKTKSAPTQPLSSSLVEAISRYETRAFTKQSGRRLCGAPDFLSRSGFTTYATPVRHCSSIKARTSRRSSATSVTQARW